MATTSGDDGDGSAAGGGDPAELSLFDFGDAPPAPAAPSRTDEAPGPQPALEEALAQPDLPAPAPESKPVATDSPPPAPAADTAPAPLAPSSLDEPPVDEPPVGNLLDGIVGQAAAVERLRAAVVTPVPSYLFVGPAGAGLRAAACRFAGELLAARSATPERERRLALAEQHPDLLVFDRVGAAMTAEQARGAVRAAAAAPVSGDQKVIVLSDIDRAGLQAPILLKSVEEPPPSCVFVLLAEEVNRAMETLASRCVRVDFEALSAADLRAVLRDDGIADERALFAAAAAGGSIERARLLASDDAAAARIEGWQGMRRSLGGTASSAMAAVDAALAATEAAAAPLETRHEAERAKADERAEQYGTNASRSTLDERHRRELRRVRTDELTMGFAVLSAQIRDEARAGALPAAAAASELSAIAEAAEALRFNANQRLALSCLFTRLGRSRR